ncbi:hypothetical protein TsFJ059_005634 [Trichoderma semiorbis]|uniref:Uncharacterized protein n=1 Tax=Trichoderma semiorbis TaxID=1491008 RepID=A0A9P8HNV6_9HYPO|nr:hypothetical protein TsFJ059_005634 [Trichoderma semiorbis]
MPLDTNHPDFWTEALQFTPTIHRDVYPAISPSNEDIQQTAHGKLVLITGAGSGFGKGAAKQWAAANASAIVLAARIQQSIDEVAESLKKTGSTTQFLPIATDVSSETDVHNLFQRAIQAFGKIDVVVHCAGVLGPLELIGDAPVDEWWQSFEINVKGTFLIARELARVSANNEATFIQTGTAASYFASAQQSSYTASKLATNMILSQLHEVELFGSLTIYLSGPKADFLGNRFIAANWDVTDLEKHQDEIIAEGLLKSQAFKGDIGPGGHKFKS